MNDIVNAFAKVASVKMNSLKEAFEKEAEKILQEMTAAINEAEAKSESEPSCEELDACTDCDGCAGCMDEEDMVETVTLGVDEFNENGDPCEIVTIYAKYLDTDPVVAVEYDKSMGATGALCAVVRALVHTIYDSMTEAGIDVFFETVEETVNGAIAPIMLESAFSDFIVGGDENA